MRDLRFSNLAHWLGLLALAVVLSMPAVARPDCRCSGRCQCGPGCSCDVWTPPPPPQPDAATVRKNQNTLTADERQAFVAAVKQLKNTYHDGATISIYDEYVHIHMIAMDQGIHEGPVFFPWHRVWLRGLELELQALDPTVTIPYWDFTVDNQVDSSVWDDDFMGGDGDPDDQNIVKTGPFSQSEWKLVFEGRSLRRQFAFFVPTLPTPDDLIAGFEVSQYDCPPYDVGSPIDQSFRNFMAGWNHPTGEPEMHNRVHNWVAGSMLGMASPNDPIFLLAHSNLDRWWGQWEAIYGFDYPESGAPPGQNLDDLMDPFLITPRDVLYHPDLGYTYDTDDGN
jgi:tyrosinase